jgi:hypothetical protein
MASVVGLGSLNGGLLLVLGMLKRNVQRGRTISCI